jgi:glycosyltransferase involved in cell wall biosynthesis
VSIVIRCHNEGKHIGRLLESLNRQSLTDHEIIVVDSGSTDTTLGIVTSFPTRVLHIAPKDFTFGRSLNVGCAQARGGILVFASAHVYSVADDWLERLVAPFADERVALTYGRQVGHETSRFSECQLFERQFPAISNLNQMIPFCNNANAAVRRSLWERHPYDETLTGLEDLAWGNWALSQGLRIAYVAEAAVVHIHEESWARVMRRYEREAIALKRIVPDSHMYVVEFIRYLSRQILGDLRALVRERRSIALVPEILMFRTMQYWGTFRGMNARSEVTQQILHKFYFPEEVRKG